MASCWVSFYLWDSKHWCLDGTLRSQSDADSATFTSGLAVNGAADTAHGMVLKKTGLSGLSSGNAGMLQFKADDSKMEFDADL